VAIAYDRVLVRDLGSRNQVRVNGRVVEEARLQPGDELAIGPVLYRLEVQPERWEPSPAATTPLARGNTPRGAPPIGVDSDDELVPLDDL
jgi:hypothetical protein